MQGKLNRNRKYITLAVTLAVVVMFLLFLGATVPAAVNAQATATPTLTLTPTNTPTLTPTPIATALANPQGSGFIQYLRCGQYSFGLITPGACLQIYNGSDAEIFSSTGARTFYVDGETGNVTASGNLTVSGTTNGLKCVNGTQNVIGSATVIPATLTAAGIATPSFVQSSLGTDATGDGLHLTHTRGSGVVTLKVWSSALTPVAATTVVAVDYEVCGN